MHIQHYATMAPPPPPTHICIALGFQLFYCRQTMILPRATKRFQAPLHSMQPFKAFLDTGTLCFRVLVL